MIFSLQKKGSLDQQTVFQLSEVQSYFDEEVMDKGIVFDQKELDLLSDMVAQVLGQKLNDLVPAQDNLLEHALGRVLARHSGKAETITDDEITGAFELVTEYQYPLSLFRGIRIRRNRCFMKESGFDLNILKKLSKDLKKHKRNTTGYKEAKKQLVEYCEQHQTHRYFASSTNQGQYNPNGSMMRKHVGEFQIIDVPDNKRGELER